MIGYHRGKVDAFVERVNEVLNPHGDTPAQIMLFLWMVESNLRPAIVDSVAFLAHQEAVWRFQNTLSTWEKANVLYELSQQVEGVVTYMARKYVRAARREDADA